MTRLFLLFLLLSSAALAQAGDPPLRLSAQLLFKEPDVVSPGRCVMYREWESGSSSYAQPAYWLKGTVVSAGILSRKLGRCPEVPGKTIEQYTREEFNRLAAAHPCVSRDEFVREEQAGMVRLRVEEWETPWAKRAANANRLYQGHFLDQALKKGMELEIEADLLGACS